tara:strand:+ start:61 stop:189 length:129 start_codon:yes stop_codon:yes gene_type:complete
MNVYAIIGKIRNIVDRTETNPKYDSDDAMFDIASILHDEGLL